MVTRSVSFGPTASVADTKTPIGTAYTFAITGTIVNARVTGYNGVTDKAESAILYLDFKKMNGPFEFACYPAGGEVTVGGKRPTETIPMEIPTDNGEVVTVSIKSAEALEDVTISLTVVE